MKRPLILVLGITLFNCLSGYAAETQNDPVIDERREEALKLFERYSRPKPGFQATPQEEDQDSGDDGIFEMDKLQEKPDPLRITEGNRIEILEKRVRPIPELVDCINKTLI